MPRHWQQVMDITGRGDLLVASVISLGILFLLYGTITNNIFVRGLKRLQAWMGSENAKGLANLLLALEMELSQDHYGALWV